VQLAQPLAEGTLQILSENQEGRDPGPHVYTGDQWAQGERSRAKTPMVGGLKVSLCLLP
jgi:hypothetical protein